jgi:hypothetical protein
VLSATTGRWLGSVALRIADAGPAPKTFWTPFRLSVFGRSPEPLLLAIGETMVPPGLGVVFPRLNKNSKFGDDLLRERNLHLFELVGHEAPTVDTYLKRGTATFHIQGNTHR